MSETPTETATAMPASPLFVVAQAPYAGAATRGALDVIMSFAVFSQQPLVLFSGDGVLALVDQQEAGGIERKSLRKVIDAFPLYDLETVYVEEQSLRERGIDATRLPEFACLVNGDEVRSLRARAAHILSF